MNEHSASRRVREPTTTSEVRVIPVRGLAVSSQLVLQVQVVAGILG